MDCGCGCNSTFRRNCGCSGLMFSAVVAAVVGVLLYFGFVPSALLAVGIILVIAALNLIFFFSGLMVAATTECSEIVKCLKNYGICYLAGIIGTIFGAIIFIAAGVSLILPISAILFAITVFFFVFMIYQLVLFWNCIIKKTNYCNREG